MHRLMLMLMLMLTLMLSRLMLMLMLTLMPRMRTLSVMGLMPMLSMSTTLRRRGGRSSHDRGEVYTIGNRGLLVFDRVFLG